MLRITLGQRVNVQGKAVAAILFPLGKLRVAKLSP